MINPHARLLQMFTEPVGHHMCDSGDYYGRNYERNQENPVQDRPEYTLSLSIKDNKIDEFQIYTPLYAELYKAIDNDDADTIRLRAIYERYIRDSKESYLADAYNFVETLKECGRISEDDYLSCLCVNTYNHETTLDQVTQYWTFEYEDQNYALISIHGGCDVRGGYTKAELFKVDVEVLVSMGTYTCFSLPTKFREDDGSVVYLNLDIECGQYLLEAILSDGNNVYKKWDDIPADILDIDAMLTDEHIKDISIDGEFVKYNFEDRS